MKSGPVTQVNGTGLPLYEVQSTLPPGEEDPETLEELYSNFTTAVEGDILLQNDRNAIEQIWQTRDIPYDLAKNLRSRTRDIIKALGIISAKTCLKFHKRGSEVDFLIFEKSRGCASYVGCIHGKQPIFIGRRCSVGNIIHEIMHALGFHHEHTRLDRDEYIEVRTQNVIKGYKNNFKKQRGVTNNIDYDVNSIMHYGGKTFSSNGEPTIISRSSTKEMGQRKRLTDSDVKKIQALYSCESSTSEPETERPPGRK